MPRDYVYTFLNIESDGQWLRIGILICKNYIGIQFLKYNITFFAKVSTITGDVYEY